MPTFYRIFYNSPDSFKILYFCFNYRVTASNMNNNYEQWYIQTFFWYLIISFNKQCLIVNILYTSQTSESVLLHGTCVPASYTWIISCSNLYTVMMGIPATTCQLWLSLTLQPSCVHYLKYRMQNINCSKILGENYHTRKEKHLSVPWILFKQLHLYFEYLMLTLYSANSW